MHWHMGAAIPSRLSEKASIALAALAGLNSGSLMSMNSRLVRSTRVPTALAFAAPLIRCPPVPRELPVLTLRRSQVYLCDRQLIQCAEIAQPLWL